MTKFDPNKEPGLSGKDLLDMIGGDNYHETLEGWVYGKSKAGLSKKQIYDTLLILHGHIQARRDPDDKLYDRLSDFMDRFTSWAKFNPDGSSARILPDEPDI